MGKIFGTDGVRGVANTELTPELAYKLGRAGAYVLTKETKHTPRIIVGMDTRISGDMLEAALVSGMCSVGAVVYIAGVIPTPAIAYLVKHLHLDAGVMISASHNPVPDNGIKFFNNKGYKLSDALEEEIEYIMLNSIETLPRPVGEEIGFKKHLESATTEYINFMKSIIEEKNMNFKGLKIALDCANGATFKAAPAIFEQLGATVVTIHDTPNGININENCGSTHTRDIVKLVKDTKADIGFAFDGDGDRCLAVDENGKVVDGDEIMSIIAVDMFKKGTLKNNTLVATVMSNLGLFVMGDGMGMSIAQTNVGDRYVLEHMIENDHNLGGEQSGHVILLDYNTTGDGILTALTLASILKLSNTTMSALNSHMKKMPQVLVNAVVATDKKNDYSKNETIMQAINNLDAKYNGLGRILIRPSGTEPLIRVMIEGEDLESIQKDAQDLANLIEEILK